MRQDTGLGEQLGVRCLEWEKLQAATACERFKREKKIKKERL